MCKEFYKEACTQCITGFESACSSVTGTDRSTPNLTSIERRYIGAAADQDVAKQRSAFAALSEGIYTLAKVSKQDTPVYYQHCPMYNGGKGANWLSKENEVKNPYYGSQMLTCGSTVETIK